MSTEHEAVPGTSETSRLETIVHWAVVVAALAGLGVAGFHYWQGLAFAFGLTLTLIVLSLVGIHFFGEESRPRGHRKTSDTEECQ
jgi:hypothetical protein